MNKKTISWTALLMAPLVITSSGCSTVEHQREMTPFERQIAENQVGTQWASTIETLMDLRQDPFLEERFISLAQQLGWNRELELAFFRIRRGEAPPVFALPGGKLYFSVAAVKPLTNDNELAAVIAAAVALAERAGLPKDWAEPSALKLSVPRYSLTEWMAVNTRVVELLYQAGIDPRGVAQFWLKATASGAGLESQMGARLASHAQEEVAKRVPLLNPVVRTSDFGRIEKRLRTL